MAKTGTRRRMRRPNGTVVRCSEPYCSKLETKHPRRHPITGNYVCSSCGEKLRRRQLRCLAEHDELCALIERHDWLVKYIDFKKLDTKW